jgi:hypothetical protein
MPSIAFGVLVSASPPPHWVELPPDEAVVEDPPSSDVLLLELLLLELVAPHPATASAPTTASATMRHQGLVIALMLRVPFLCPSVNPSG